MHVYAGSTEQAVQLAMCNAPSQALAETPAKEFEPNKASHMLLSGKATPLCCLPRDQPGRKLTFSRTHGFSCKCNAISSVLKSDGADSGASPGSALDFHQLLLKTQQRIIQVHPAAATHSGKHKAQQSQVKLVHAGSRSLGKQQPDLSTRQMGNNTISKRHHSRHGRRLPAREGM